LKLGAWEKGSRDRDRFKFLFGGLKPSLVDKGYEVEIGLNSSLVD
jgi:hypothetical protein